ncbi:ankyrin repeat domain-containing protein [Microbulbifer sp. ALW1]|uniref:ankyrin repeat domain-containing protein n=1 Tax=Microbulbifer sp. (strain ALW1) TaxID=1516059 RepID=UPI00135A0712|nr:ankyrin repeat domain-containing protein [Microbulbifer sp. ALW1]
MRDLEAIFREIEKVPDFMGHTIDSVSYRNGYGDTPLHIVSNWGDVEAIEILISAGADINAVGESGFTPLHCAAEQNRPKAIEVLLRLGANILKDEDGSTPMEIAEFLNNREATVALERNI